MLFSSFSVCRYFTWPPAARGLTPGSKRINNLFESTRNLSGQTFDLYCIAFELGRCGSQHLVNSRNRRRCPRGSNANLHPLLIRLSLSRRALRSVVFLLWKRFIEQSPAPLELFQEWLQLLLPLIGPFTRAIERLVPDRGSSFTRYLDPAALAASPTIAVEAARRTVAHVLATLCSQVGSLDEGSAASQQKTGFEDGPRIQKILF